MILWECLDDKAKDFIRSIMPKDWSPPTEEHIDKINKEISRKPHYGKRRLK